MITFINVPSTKQINFCVCKKGALEALSKKLAMKFGIFLQQNFSLNIIWN